MNIEWDSSAYKDNFSFVPHYGEAVLELITKREGIAVDLGCGNGSLTPLLKARGFSVIGIDQSEDMIALAKKDHEDIPFIVGDALTFTLPEKADLVFSNAVFHWIDDGNQDEMIMNIARNMKKGGELVTEFGGKGCAETVHSCLETIFREMGLSYKRAFYFPGIGEYTARLEKKGFLVNYAILFDRPTVQKGDDGLINWVKMFCKEAFKGLPDENKETIFSEARRRLKGTLYKDDAWFIDYVRIRIRAVLLA